MKSKPRLLPGQRMVLLFTFPSGNEYVAGQEKGELAFIPTSEVGAKVLVWDSHDAVVEWLKKFKAQNGDEKFRALMALKMRIRPIAVGR